MNNKESIALKIGCVILAGGKSSRMGEDKALLKYEGKFFVEKIAEELYFFEEKIVARGNNPELEDFVKKNFWKVIPDEYENHGPLGGLHAALEKCDSDALFVVTCDIFGLFSTLLFCAICPIFPCFLGFRLFFLTFLSFGWVELAFSFPRSHFQLCIFPSTDLEVYIYCFMFSVFTLENLMHIIA